MCCDPALIPDRNPCIDTQTGWLGGGESIYSDRYVSMGGEITARLVDDGGFGMGGVWMVGR
jgi:hypothetical protein